MSRQHKQKPVDLAANLARVTEERAEAERALAELAAERQATVRDITVEGILELDRQQDEHRAAIEQANARATFLRCEINREAAEAEAAAGRRAYDEATAARAAGVVSLADLKRHLAAGSEARARLLAAKRAVTEANRSLPEGCERLGDPEGPVRTSILDTIRLPIHGAPI